MKNTIKIIKKNTTYLILLVLILSPLSYSNSVYSAETPRTIGYQGVLKQKGYGVDGSVNMTFKLYDSATGGSALWTESHTGSNSVRVVNGYFSVSLGSITTIPASVDFSSAYFLEITVKSVVLSPRTTLNAVPYARVALGAESRADAPSTTIDGSLYFDPTGEGSLYVYDSTVGWSTVNKIQATSTLDETYDAFLTNASKIVVDAAEGQTGGLEFETANTQNIIFDIGGTGSVLFQDGGSTFMTLLDGGKVGIGTSPSTKLHIVDTSEQSRLGYDASNYWSNTIDSNGNLTMQGVGTAGALTLSPASGQNINLSMSGSGDLAVNTNQLYVDTSSGNIGLGDSTPSYTLDVNGPGRFTGLVDASHFVATSTTATSSLEHLNLKGSLTLNSQAGTSGQVLTSQGTSSDPIWTTILVSVGDVVGSGTSGSILFLDSSSQLAQDNTNFFWDDTNNRLGLGDSTPTHALDVAGKIGINDTQALYIPGGNFTGTMIVGNGGQNLSYGGGNDGKRNTFVGIDSGSTNTTGYDNSALGWESLKSNTTGYYNTALGTQSLKSNTTGYYNTTVGDSSLRLNTTGWGNTAVGWVALDVNTTGYSNTAVGVESLRTASTAIRNTAIGFQSLSLTTTGSYNTASGMEALEKNTTGANNSAHGASALGVNTTGNYNSAYGAYSLFANTTGSYNTASGVYGLRGITTGSYNTAIGYYAGRYLADNSSSNETTSNSVFIGYRTKASADGVTNENVFGNEATGIGSNSVVLGNDSVTTTALKGNVGIGTTTPQQKLHVVRSTDGAPVRFEDSNGYCEIDPTSTTWTCTSDVRLKNNIASLDSPLSLQKLSELRPVSFTWKSDGSNKERQGFIAQEVEKIFPHLVKNDSDTGYKSVSYGGFSVYIVSAIKELAQKIDALAKNIKAEVVSAVQGTFENLTVKKLCIEDVCIDKNQLKTILDDSNTKTKIPLPTVIHNSDNKNTAEENLKVDIIENTTDTVPVAESENKDPNDTPEEEPEVSENDGEENSTLTKD